MKVYTIRDLVAEEFGPVFTQPNDACALRSARETLRNVPPHMINDYRLYGVGDFDEKVGILLACPQYQVEGALFVLPKLEVKKGEGKKNFNPKQELKNG